MRATSNGHHKNGRPENGHIKRVAKQRTLEDMIVDMALRGDLAKATKEAFRRQRKAGLPITFQRGRKIVKRYPGGKEVVLGEVAGWRRRILPGVSIFGRK